MKQLEIEHTKPTKKEILRSSLNSEDDGRRMTLERNCPIRKELSDGNSIDHKKLLRSHYKKVPNNRCTPGFYLLFKNLIDDTTCSNEFLVMVIPCHDLHRSWCAMNRFGII